MQMFLAWVGGVFLAALLASVAFFAGGGQGYLVAVAKDGGSVSTTTRETPAERTAVAKAERAEAKKDKLCEKFYPGTKFVPEKNKCIRVRTGADALAVAKAIPPSKNGVGGDPRCKDKPDDFEYVREISLPGGGIRKITMTCGTLPAAPDPE